MNKGKKTAGESDRRVNKSEITNTTGREKNKLLDNTFLSTGWKREITERSTRYEQTKKPRVRGVHRTLCKKKSDNPVELKMSLQLINVLFENRIRVYAILDGLIRVDYCAVVTAAEMKTDGFER